MPYSPWDLLPCKHPKEEEFKHDPLFFYDEVVQHLIPDIVRIMNNGIPIDLDKVSQLEVTVDEVLLDVESKINNSTLMKEFLQAKYQYLRSCKKDEFELKKKTQLDFIKPFKHGNKVHRKYVVEEYLKSINKLEEYQLEEWLIKDVKALDQVEPSRILMGLIDKTLSSSNQLVLRAMEQLAHDKAEIYNKKYDDKFDNLTEADVLQSFNCGSSIQLREFFTYLGIESESTSKTTGEFSYARKELERILAEVTLYLERYEDG